MIQTNSENLSLEQAQAMLQQFDYDRSDPVASTPQQVQAALKQVAQHSDYQILGICADHLDQGRTALVAYATALGYPVQPDGLTSIDGPVYIKFNPKTGLLYSDRYVGDHRGVLVSCQSAYAEGLNEMYGHLPLDLFSATA
ncbi:MAG: DUF1824 family protein [Synechococcales cyanobacterium K44_A2020_017]|jgi:hypothetical protein|nr:DUF1824 family protein [Synechococcales cyanobacterium K32_A2020_035]MBF2093724.1 DUF1824 family protein [Synechococcales cyanobacterium K44_A2020_017]